MENLIEINCVDAPTGCWEEVCYEVKKFRKSTGADEIFFERRDYEDFLMVTYKKKDKNNE